MEIVVSYGAVEWIRARGRCLYLWNESWNADYMLDRSEVGLPGRDGFDIIDTGQIYVGFENGMDLPVTLAIRRKLWPLGGLTIFWDGEAWGWRGADWGGGGGG